MKKYKITALMLTLAMTLSAFTACKPDDSNDGSSYSSAEKGEIARTDKILVENGSTSYSICIPADASETVSFAAEELKYFFKESTGATLSIDYSANDKSFDESMKYISLGNTSLLQDARISVSYDELSDAGYVCKTVGNTVFICGATDNGTLYGVYGFLEEIMAWECYAADEIYYEQVAKEYLPAFNETVMPTFSIREATNFNSVRYDDSTYITRLKLNQLTDTFIPLGGKNLGNTLGMLPLDTYYDEHPEWYTPAMKDICYSNDELFEEAFKNICKDVIAYPDRVYVIVGQMDNCDYCACEKCTAIIEKYGAKVATQILFIKKMQPRLQEWMDASYAETGDEVYNRRLQVGFFAYQNSLQPPTQNLEDMVLGEDIFVLYAPIEANYTVPFTDAANAGVRHTIEGWSQITSNLFCWLYCQNFGLYLYPTPHQTVMQENFAYLSEVGVAKMFVQGTSESTGTAFDIFKEYLNAELTWDCTQSTVELTDKFFTNYFKQAAEPMRKLYDEQQARYRYCFEYLGMSQSLNGRYDDAKFLPYQLLMQWQGYIDEAYDCIAPLKETDAKLYQTLYDRIELESLSIMFMLQDLHSTCYSESELLALRLEIKRIANKNDLRNYEEQIELTTIYSGWGI